MYKFIFFILCNLTATSLIAQESFLKISLSGFIVNLTQSDQFSIEVDTTVSIEKIVENETLYIGVTDQTGSVPKSTISIRVDKLNYLELHNSKLVMERPVIVDTLAVELACSSGTLKVNANVLNITAGAATQFSGEGNAQNLTCNVGGASSLSLSKLITDQAELTIMGHSQLYVNAKDVVLSECDKNSHLTNFAK